MLRSSTVSKTREDGCRTAAHQQGAGAWQPSSAPARHGLCPISKTTSSTLLPQLLVPHLKSTFRRTRLFVIAGLLRAAQVTGGLEKQPSLAVAQEEPRGLRETRSRGSQGH